MSGETNALMKQGGLEVPTSPSIRMTQGGNLLDGMKSQIWISL
jgi:hypothetical protein